MSGEALEWQVASGSPTGHVFNVRQPRPRRDETGYRKSGPRALCGRYPQRNAEGPWFSHPVGPEAERAMSTYWVQMCNECESAVKAVMA